MSTIFTHTAIPLVIGLGIGRKTVSPRLIAVGCLLTILPDIDVVGFFNGVSYYSPYGHRGFTHSIVFALTCGLLAATMHHWMNAKPLVVFLFVSCATISHGVLDALTYGGLGIAFFWPFSEARYFFPWRPLEASPIGIRHFFNRWGLYVFKTELVRVILPLIAAGTVLWLGRVFFRRLQKKTDSSGERVTFNLRNL